MKVQNTRNVDGARAVYAQFQISKRVTVGVGWVTCTKGLGQVGLYHSHHGIHAVTKQPTKVHMVCLWRLRLGFWIEDRQAKVVWQ